MIVTRDIGFIDVGIAGFSAMVGILSANIALGLWRQRNGGMLLRAVVFKLSAFAMWSFLVFGNSLYQWREHFVVQPFVQGMTNLDRLVLSIPMAVIFIWILPLVGRV